MIESLFLKWFETHVDTKIEFHPRVNVITGESDEGKSSIVRGITLNAQNTPMGDGYRNDTLTDDKKDKKILTESGVQYKGTGLVVRDRNGSGINRYTINGGDPLKALRTDIPDEVQDVTRMKTVNIQGQHPNEQYFLLTEKPGQVAKELNKVSGLSIMDDAIKDINSQVRACNTEISVDKDRIKKCKEELKELEWVPKALKMASKIQSLTRKIKSKIRTRDELQEIVIKLNNLDKQLTDFNGIEEALNIIDQLNYENLQIKRLQQEQSNIQNTTFQLSAVDSELDAIRDTSEALIALKSLKNESDKIEEKQTALGVLNKLLSDIDYADKEVKVAKKKLKDIQLEKDRIFAEEACPTCGRTGE